MALSNPRILLCSEHCLCDGASGAAISASELLGLLRGRGWEVSVLCGGKMDGPGHAPVGEVVRRDSEEGDLVAVHHLDWRGIPVRIVRPGGGVGGDAGMLGLPLLLERELRVRKPDVILVYGGGWIGRAILKTARRHGVPAVFWLRNNYYSRKDLFEDVSGVVVPSSFTSRMYQERLGLVPQVLYPTVIRERVHCPVRQPKYLTYVAPMPEKGVYFFARLASELGRRRPDVEVLVVEGRGSLEWLGRTGLDVMELSNVRVMPRTEDPRQFLAVTRALVFPSLWDEPFGRTAVEAMVSGIPVIASNRGGLPEVVGTGGMILPIASRLTGTSQMLATVGEVQPWVAAISRMWDEEEWYREVGRNAVSSAARFDPDVIADRADVLLRGWAGAPVQAKLVGVEELLRSSEYPGDVESSLRAWAGLTDEAADRMLVR